MARTRGGRVCLGELRCRSEWTRHRLTLLRPLSCFLTPMKRAHLNLPYLARESELETLKLPAKRKVEYLRCHDPVYDQVRPH